MDSECCWSRAFYWLPGPPRLAIMRRERGLWWLWCRSRDVLILGMRHKTLRADTDYWHKICFDRSHYREWLIIGPEFYLHWSICYLVIIGLCSHQTLAMIPREPDVFICDSLSPDQNRRIDKQDPSEITDEQSEPGWHSHRCVNHPSHWSSKSPTPCFLLTINEITEKIFFIFCHMLISTLWWKR